MAFRATCRVTRINPYSFRPSSSSSSSVSSIMSPMMSSSIGRWTAGRYVRRVLSSDAKTEAPEPTKSFFKSDKWTKTVGTVGALANWTLPMAAIAHITSGKDPATTISLPMTSVLCVYSLAFCRWALAITPANYPLLVCHASNEVIQLFQLYRVINARYLNPSSSSTATATAAVAASEKKQ